MSYFNFGMKSLSEKSALNNTNRKWYWAMQEWVLFLFGRLYPYTLQSLSSKARLYEVTYYFRRRSLICEVNISCLHLTWWFQYKTLKQWWQKGDWWSYFIFKKFGCRAAWCPKLGTWYPKLISALFIRDNLKLGKMYALSIIGISSCDWFVFIRKKM